jgi:hypothetical protein
MLLYRQLASLVSINTLNDIKEYIDGVDNMSVIQAYEKL